MIGLNRVIFGRDRYGEQRSEQRSEHYDTM